MLVSVRVVDDDTRRDVFVAQNACGHLIIGIGLPYYQQKQSAEEMYENE